MIKLINIARPQFLIVGLTLFVLGALWAILLGAGSSLLRLVVGYLVVLPAQLSVHFSNDYFDMASDRPGGTTLISGGGGILFGHPELREPVKWIALALILLSSGLGIVFIWIYSYPFWMIVFVILGNLLGWSYSAPPFKLSHRGFGEVCYALIAGFLLPSMGYLVMRGTLDLNGIFFLVPLTLYGLVSILSVEIPDLEDDRLGDKLTWVARIGRPFGFSLIGGLLITATTYFFIFPVFYNRWIPIDLHVFGWLSLLPLGAGIAGLVKRPIDRGPATKIATWIVILLAVFSIFVDSYLSYLALNQR